MGCSGHAHRACRTCFACLPCMQAVHAVVGGVCNWAEDHSFCSEALKLHDGLYMPNLRRSQLHWAWPEVIKNSLAHQVMFCAVYGRRYRIYGRQGGTSGRMAVSAMTVVTSIDSCTSKSPTTPVLLIITLLSLKSSPLSSK